MGIKDAHSLPSVAQEDLRYKAVKAVLNGKQLKLPGQTVVGGSLPGTTEVAILSFLWTRKAVAQLIDRTEVWHSAFALNGWSLSSTLGFYLRHKRSGNKFWLQYEFGYHQSMAPGFYDIHQPI